MPFQLHYLSYKKGKETFKKSFYKFIVKNVALVKHSTIFLSEQRVKER